MLVRLDFLVMERNALISMNALASLATQMQHVAIIWDHTLVHVKEDSQEMEQIVLTSMNARGSLATQMQLAAIIWDHTLVHVN